MAATVILNTDHAAAAAIYASAYSANNAFNWVQQLAIPAAQAAAQILILNHQKDQYDDIENRRVGYLDAAVTQWCDCINLLIDDLEAATDDVPEPALYQPVSPAGEQFDTINQNHQMMCDAKDYEGDIGKYNLQIDLARATVLNPKYYQMNEVTWCSIEKLMNGELPVGLTVQSLTKSAGQTFSQGRLGRSAGHYRRNLGILDYQIQREARKEQREERASQASHVSTLARQGDIREMMQTPQQRMAYALQQAQLIQNSLQNVNNAKSKKAPFLMQKIQLGLQKCQQQMQLTASKASLVNSYVPDFASVLNNQVRDIIQGVGDGIGSIGNNQDTPNRAPMPSPVFQPTTHVGDYK